MDTLRKYKWYLIMSMLMILCFISLAVWVYVAADAPQQGPFEYQVF